MKSIKAAMLFCATSIIIASCSNSGTFKKTKGGMPYQLISGDGKVKSAPGNSLKINYAVYIKEAGKKDSLLASSYTGMPAYIPVQESQVGYDISELFIGRIKGDSIVATQLVDSLMKKSPQGNFPSFFKNGNQLITKLFVLDVFTSDSAKAADETAFVEKIKNDEKGFIEKYLADKKITTVKTPSGVFVQILTPGEGEVAGMGKEVAVSYTGTAFFSGKKFDSNVDTSFHNNKPLTFTTGARQMIAGFDEAVQMLKPGSEAKIYIPSMLGYGPNPQSPDIKPFEHLIFDIKLLSVKEPAKQALPEKGQQLGK